MDSKACYGDSFPFFLIYYLFNDAVSTTITVMNNIRGSVFYLEHDVSETGFCLRLQVEPAHLEPVCYINVPSLETYRSDLRCQ
jgi:hypothetical protein